jgi:hypothetical protein
MKIYFETILLLFIADLLIFSDTVSCSTDEHEEAGVFFSLEVIWFSEKALVVGSATIRQKISISVKDDF